MSEEQSDAAAGSAEAGEREFAIQKVYLKDVSFESPQAPEVFLREWRPEVSMELGTQAEPVGEDVYEVVLTVTVTAKEGEAAGYLAEAKQAGLFSAKGFSRDQLGHLLGSYCPSILFPFAREAIADLVAKGGFPQVLLAPVNFDALYTQHMEERRRAQPASDDAPDAAGGAQVWRPGS
ncbi:MAG: protein-export chaperone SecB [Gammaproteobacteria bacterium]|nr:protein-export chaperone SecB [Gammaproteobacteria bacterium]